MLTNFFHIDTNPLDCDFESANTCLWHNDLAYQLQLTIKAGSTDTFGTGPSSDHTLANNAGRS